MKKGFVVAIDGPVASGKGTIAPMLAEKLGGFYLDTGIFYRALALYCLEHTIDPANEHTVIGYLPDFKIHLVGDKVLLNGDDVTTKIRTIEVSNETPKVAAIAQVREEMVRQQRAICQARIDGGSIVVIEGRDSATATFPDAEVKIFLTARLSVRADRRLKQYLAKGAEHISLAEVAEDIKNRDKQDMTRSAYPLSRDPKAHGYIVLDNSDMKQDETLAKMMDIVNEKGYL